MCGGARDTKELKDAGVYAMIDSLVDVDTALKEAKPESLSRLYQSLRVGINYKPHARTVEATIAPRVVSVRVRGGIEHVFVASLRNAGVHATDDSCVLRSSVSWFPVTATDESSYIPVSLGEWTTPTRPHASCPAGSATSEAGVKADL